MRPERPGRRVRAERLGGVRAEDAGVHLWIPMREHGVVPATIRAVVRGVSVPRVVESDDGDDAVGRLEVRLANTSPVLGSRRSTVVGCDARDARERQDERKDERGDRGARHRARAAGSDPRGECPRQPGARRPNAFGHGSLGLVLGGCCISWRQRVQGYSSCASHLRAHVAAPIHHPPRASRFKPRPRPIARARSRHGVVRPSPGLSLLRGAHVPIQRRTSSHVLVSALRRASLTRPSGPASPSARLPATTCARARRTMKSPPSWTRPPRARRPRRSSRSSIAFSPTAATSTRAIPQTARPRSPSAPRRATRGTFARSSPRARTSVPPATRMDRRARRRRVRLHRVPRRAPRRRSRPSAVAASGKTPMDIARQYGKPEAEAFLRQRGARWGIYDEERRRRRRRGGGGGAGARAGSTTRSPPFRPARLLRRRFLFAEPSGGALGASPGSPPPSVDRGRDPDVLLCTRWTVSNARRLGISSRATTSWSPRPRGRARPWSARRPSSPRSRAGRKPSTPPRSRRSPTRNFASSRRCSARRRVGLKTADAGVNSADADVVVMTTEILRNMLCPVGGRGDATRGWTRDGRGHRRGRGRERRSAG